MNLLMITGDRSLAEGKHGAFYNTMDELHKYWDRIDIICPAVVTTNCQLSTINYFGNVYIHPSPWPLVFQPFWIWKMGKDIFRKNKFDLMTVHEYPPFYNGLGAKFLHSVIKVPYILEVMHIPGYPRATNFKERFYQALMKKIIKWDASKAKAIRIINQKETPDFLVQAGVDKAKMKYIPAFYIDLEVFTPRDIRKDYDLVFAARLEKNKGIFNLIEAIRIAKQTKPDIKLLIIGQGSELENIKLQTTNYKLQTNIFFSGWLATAVDVAKAYNSARCFINPSYNEGGPRVVLEAMACGLPVITTPVGLMIDIIRDGQNGLVTDWDMHKMSDKIIILLRRFDLREKFSAAGLELVQQFEKKETIKNYAVKLQQNVI